MIPKYEHIASNFVSFTDKDGVKYWFSYKTCVAFERDGEVYCIENLWGPTTATHLNAIQPNKSKRVKADDFNALLGEKF